MLGNAQLNARTSEKEHKSDNAAKPSSPQTSLNQLWTRKQVAKAIGVCPHTVARWTRLGVLPAVKLNARVIRYEAAVVQTFIQSGAIGH